MLIAAVLLVSLSLTFVCALALVAGGLGEADARHDAAGKRLG